ncbi:IS3 family transposase [Domibacillus epiphyticus]|uniref:IS3 family transposase n=1 Tax=Domibacillus epiphyticus TaxID=1714355 RepID=UPI0009FAC30C
MIGEFDSLKHLTLEFSDYVNWFNKLRIHGTLGYVSPIEYKRSSLKKAAYRRGIFRTQVHPWEQYMSMY